MEKNLVLMENRFLTLKKKKESLLSDKSLVKRLPDKGERIRNQLTLINKKLEIIKIGKQKNWTFAIIEKKCIELDGKKKKEKEIKNQTESYSEQYEDKINSIFQRIEKKRKRQGRISKTRKDELNKLAELEKFVIGKKAYENNKQEINDKKKKRIKFKEFVSLPNKK